MWARRSAERLRVPFVIAMVIGAWGLVRLLTIGPWWDLLVSASSVFLAVAVAVGSRARYLARLQPAGYWRQAEATAPSWRVRRDGLADGTVALGFPDGRRCTARLDLFANVVREKGLWVAGDRVAGFPAYKILAAARFS